LSSGCRRRNSKPDGIDVTGRDVRNTLADYPWPMVRVACRYCDRRGRYRIESLIARYGHEATYAQVLTCLSSDCTRASDRTNRSGECHGAYFPDVERKHR
jgi:hypothetical protein